MNLNELKCPHCHAVGPRINCSGLRWPNGVNGAIFACVSCKHILSVSVIPRMDVDDPNIMRPSPDELRLLANG